MYINKPDIYFRIYFVVNQRYSDFVFTELSNIDIMNLYTFIWFVIENTENHKILRLN